VKGPNKENRFSSQSNLNRTASALPSDGRRNTAGAAKTGKESVTAHYQSHREFGKEIQNNATDAASRNGSHSTKVSNAPGASAALGASHNVSLFKNFMSQYANNNNQTMNYAQVAERPYAAKASEQRTHNTTRANQTKGKASLPTSAADVALRYSNKTSVSHYDMRNNSGPS
jgi:hypothetical protein